MRGWVKGSLRPGIVLDMENTHKANEVRNIPSRIFLSMVVVLNECTTHIYIHTHKICNYFQSVLKCLKPIHGLICQLYPGLRNDKPEEEKGKMPLSQQLYIPMLHTVPH